MWFGVAIWLIPIVSVLLHFIWPHSLLLKILANASILFAGTVWLSVIEEIIDGAKQFSLPLLAIAIIILVGAILSVWYGWLSTGIILGLYASVSIRSGIHRRFNV
jgi:hypothetical protein